MSNPQPTHHPLLKATGASANIQATLHHPRLGLSVLPVVKDLLHGEGLSSNSTERLYAILPSSSFSWSLTPSHLESLVNLNVRSLNQPNQYWPGQ